MSVLIILILITLAIGIAKSVIDVLSVISLPLEIGMRKVIVDVLILLAVVEIYKTTFTYFTEGRVRVTYIVDTVLVVMLSEVISLWFRDENLLKLGVLILVLFALIVIRIMAIRFHPISKNQSGIES